MIEVIYDRAFSRQAAGLGPKARQKLATLIAVLSEDPYDSRLHTKRLSEPLAGILSVPHNAGLASHIPFSFTDNSTPVRSQTQKRHLPIECLSVENSMNPPLVRRTQ